MLGIVSGAMEGAARVKLGRGDLNRFFLFGGYGTDSSDRTKLTLAAIARASMLHHHVVEPARVYVVGDTPRDVAAAKAAGAVAVSVASGKYSVEALAAAGADHVLPSLAGRFPDVGEPDAVPGTRISSPGAVARARPGTAASASVGSSSAGWPGSIEPGNIRASGRSSGSPTLKALPTAAFEYKRMVVRSHSSRHP